jgi:dTDP-L-rhamnose 4-epimerase
MSADHVLVTGGAGFIGSAIVDQLRARDVDVTVLDNLDPAAHAERPDYLRDDVRYVWADVRDAAAWQQALRGVTAVCHQAGKVGLGVDFGDVCAYVGSNDTGWASGLSVLHDRGFAGPIVLASSMVVYGEGRYVCAEHGVVRPLPRAEADLLAGRFETRCPQCGSELAAEPIGEDAPLDPRNVYAATKLHQEHLLNAFEREHSVRAVSLRYHNVYGPRMPFNTPYAGVASIFRSALEQAQAPKVTEDGRQRRNFVHVADVARANVCALLDSEASGAFNVASQTSMTVGEMAEALAIGMGSRPGDERWPVVTGGYRLGDVRHVFASPDRAAEVLGFSAATTAADGMAGFATDPLRGAVR